MIATSFVASGQQRGHPTDISVMGSRVIATLFAFCSMLSRPVTRFDEYLDVGFVFEFSENERLEEALMDLAGDVKEAWGTAGQISCFCGGHSSALTERMQTPWLIGAPKPSGFDSPARRRAMRPRPPATQLRRAVRLPLYDPQRTRILWLLWFDFPLTSERAVV